MESSESAIRIPAVLMPSYNKLITTEEGKSAMKRIRVECGVCKLTRFYSINRGITRIAGVVACETCRQFYQRFKKQPKLQQCDKGGKCFVGGEMPKKCTACSMAHILSTCPVTSSLYLSMLSYFPADIKKRLPERPLTLSEVPEDRRGGLGLEVYKGDTWEDVTDREEMMALNSKEGEEEADGDDAHGDDMDMEFEEMVVEESEESSESKSTPPVDLPAPPAAPVSRAGRPAKKTKQKQQVSTSNTTNSKTNPDPDQRTDHGSSKGDTAVMASLLEGLKVNNQFMENFNPKTSERMRRKKKKVHYFNSFTRGRGSYTSTFHGSDGTLIASGKDLCDCLISDCPGCHFPCIKCGSGKCGKECRVNRKWYYDKVEVEGSSVSWNNEFTKKM